MVFELLSDMTIFDKGMRTVLKIFCGLALACLGSCGGDSLEDLLSVCSDSSISIDEIVTTNSSCESVGSIDIIVSGGTSPYEYSLTGAQFQSSKLFNVSAGNYVVYVRDAKGCSINTSASVNAESGSVEINSISSTAGDCGGNNGTLSVVASGGTGLLSYQLDGSVAQPESSFSNVATGQHIVTVIDQVDCATERGVWLPSGVGLVGEIMPIMLANCANSSSCHSSGAPRVDLSNPSNVISQSAAIKTRTQNGSMPPRGGPSLSQESKDLIACWVDDGALNN
jgi:hypothetical protein